MKIQDGGGHHIEFRKMSMFGLDEGISTKFGGQMHHGHMKIIAGTLITLSTTAR